MTRPSVLLISASLVISLLTFQYGPAVSSGSAILLLVIIVTCVWPELGTLTAFAALYSNLPAIAVTFHNVPAMAAAAIPLSLCAPIIHHVSVRRERLVVDHAFLLMLLFLIALMSSSLFAKDTQIALEWILTFVAEGIVPYFLIINAVRCRSTLRRVVTVVMLTCGILGGLSLYQEVTQSYNNQFGGFAQRNLEYVTDGGSGAPLQSDSPLQERDHVRVANRSGGPIGGPNRYAQIMIVILPLALFRFWGETSRWPRLFGGTAAILIASGVLLSYSRGAFLTLLLLVLALVILGYVRLYQALLTGAVLFLAIAMAAPGYLGRMDTIRNASSLISSEAGGERPDGAIRGRATEMFAALQAFLEYPILGVGPGQYTPFYSAHYHLSNEDAFRYLPRSRRAHTLYFELGAETGIVGLSLFLWIAWLLVRSLLQMRRDLRVNCPELSNTATALVLSIMAYFGTAVFLHLSYQRYYWLLLALAGATVQIAKAETFPKSTVTYRA